MEIITILKACLMFLGIMVLLAMLLITIEFAVIIWVNTRSKNTGERIDNEAKDC